jgi:hypothetical protein
MLCLRAGLYREYTPIKVILATLQEQAMSKPTGMRLATFVRSAHLGARRLVVTVLAVMLPAAHAGNYPSKPLRLVVGLPAGGGADAIARIIASKLSDKVVQPVIVENRPGLAAANRGGNGCTVECGRLHAAVRCIYRTPAYV